MNEAYMQPKARPKHNLLVVFAILAILSLAGCGLLYLQHRKDQRLISASGAAGQAESQTLVKQVSRLMVLPANEKPTIATVSDSRKLPRHIFFQHARNGDKVLIYTKARTAILYDPKQNLIVAVSPLDIKPAAGTKP